MAVRDPSSLSKLRRDTRLPLPCYLQHRKYVMSIKIELGEPNVAMGSYFQVLRVLGIETDFDLLAEDDTFGRKLQDLNMATKRRAPKREAKS